MVRSIEQALFACEEYLRNAYYAQEAQDEGAIARHVLIAQAAYQQVQHCLVDAQHLLQEASKRQDAMAECRGKREQDDARYLSQAPLCLKCAFEIADHGVVPDCREPARRHLGRCVRCDHANYPIGLFLDKHSPPPFTGEWCWNDGRGPRGMWEPAK